jgi:hypothetical protein
MQRSIWWCRHRGSRARRRAAACRRDRDHRLVRARARSAGVPAPPPGGHGDQRQDVHHRVGRGDARGCRATRRRVRKHRTPAQRRGCADPPDTVLVAELSSFQLRFAETLRPTVGVVLNIADDHLDWHGDATAYGRAKARIWVGQTADDWAVANEDDPTSVALRDRHAPGRPASFSGTQPVATGVGRRGDVLVFSDPDGATTDLLTVDDLTSQAPHHIANVAAAATLAALAGVALTPIVEAWHAATTLGPPLREGRDHRWRALHQRFQGDQRPRRSSRTGSGRRHRLDRRRPLQGGRSRPTG